MVNFIEPRHGFDGNYAQRSTDQSGPATERDIIQGRIASRAKWRKRARWLRIKARFTGRSADRRVSRPAALRSVRTRL